MPPLKAASAAFRRGLVVGKFAPLHKGHQKLIETAMARCKAVTVLVYATPDFVAMPGSMRAGWLRSLYPALDVHVPAGAPLDCASDDEQRAFVKSWLLAHGIVIDAVFTSEAYGPGFAQHLGVPHVSIDQARTQFAVSGTAIRADLAAHSAFLHPLVFRQLSNLKQDISLRDS